MIQPFNSPYERRFQDPRQWPSSVVFGLYAEAVTERRVNELSWEWAGLQVADEASTFLQEVEGQHRRLKRRETARVEGWVAGEPGE